MTCELKKIIIAIDGYSSSGKSTMAKQLAAKIGYAYIDSGAMYRAVTLFALRNSLVEDGKLNVAALVERLPEIHISFKSTPEGNRTLLNGEDVEKQIRTIEVSNMVSPVSAVPEVRHYLTRQQQSYGVEKGIVMDGRDIGTTVFPQAEMKVFVDASPEVRATRRFKELEEKGMPASYDEVYANIVERDRIDTTRKESPLRKADDALVLNNDHLTREQQMQWLLDTFENIANRCQP